MVIIGTETDLETIKKMVSSFIDPESRLKTRKMSLGIPPYIQIVGHGRSGTNWLLDILDASEFSHCRNEPDEVPESCLAYLHRLWYSDKALESVTEQWDSQIRQAKLCMSKRDHHVETPKKHIYPFAQKSGLATLPTRAKARQVLQAFFPELRRGEWKVPRWIADEDRLAQACAVFKINMLVAWFVSWLLNERPQIPVIHIVRHPGGYFNSSLQRFFSKRTDAELAAESQFYKTLLRTAVQVYPQWANRIGDIDALSLKEAVLWFWCLNNEMIYREGKEKPNYRLLIYEDMVANSQENCRKIYDFCRLPWNHTVEQQIAHGLGQSVWGNLKASPTEVAQAWHKQLEPEDQALVQQILAKSLMQSWWP